MAQLSLPVLVWTTTLSYVTTAAAEEGVQYSDRRCFDMQGRENHECCKLSRFQKSPMLGVWSYFMVDRFRRGTACAVVAS